MSKDNENNARIKTKNVYSETMTSKQYKIFCFRVILHLYNGPRIDNIKSYSLKKKLIKL